MEERSGEENIENSRAKRNRAEEIRERVEQSTVHRRVDDSGTPDLLEPRGQVDGAPCGWQLFVPLRPQRGCMKTMRTHPIITTCRYDMVIWVWHRYGTCSLSYRVSSAPCCLFGYFSTFCIGSRCFPLFF